MIDKSNEPINRRADGTYVVEAPNGRYHVCPKFMHPTGVYDITEVEAYVAEHPEALIPEPLPPEPSAEEIAVSKKAMKDAEDEAKELELDRQWIREQRKKAGK